MVSAFPGMNILFWPLIPFLVAFKSAKFNSFLLVLQFSVNGGIGILLYIAHEICLFPLAIACIWILKVKEIFTI